MVLRWVVCAARENSTHFYLKQIKQNEYKENDTNCQA